MKYISKLLILVSVLVAMSCAQEVGTIDKVQPDYHSKKFFDGEWYTRTTIVDVPFSTGFTFVGEQGDLSIIKWDIQENYLIGYRTYEHNPGSEAYLKKGETFGTVCTKGEDLKVLGYNENCPEGYELKSREAFQGTPVVAYRIKKHFDIIRRYNTTTGEQTNVLVEDTQDHEWYDRKYIRVDWSSNLIPDFRMGSVSGIPKALDFYCSGTVDPGDTHCDRWKPTFEKDENGNGTYFAIVGKVLAQPSTFNYYGTIYPMCYLDDTQDCLGQEITYKSDFYKKLPKHYNETPVDYDEMKMKKFGFFRTEKYVYDKDKGFLEDAKIYRANIFDIFKRDSNGTPNGVKPVIYYVNRDFPKELMPAAKMLGNGYNKTLFNGETEHRKGWNDVLKEVAKQVLGDKFDPNTTDMFVVCGNPVDTKIDHILCGEDGFSPRVGDLRYNMVYWVNNPQKSSPLGYGPLAADPITGRTISANAFIYGDILDWYAQYILDLVDLFNGDINLSDYISGKYVARYFEEKAERHPETNSYFNLKSKSNNLVVGKSFLNRSVTPDALESFNQTLEAKRLQIKNAIKDGKMKNNHFDSRLSAIAGTSVEDSLITKDIKALFGTSKDYVDSPSSDSNRSMISPSNWLSSKSLRRDAEMKRILAKRTIMMSDFLEDSLIGTARQLADKNLSKEEMYNYIRKEVFLSTTIHELGHNLGLRHNFASHTDALNFFPEYWEIRLENSANFETKDEQGDVLGLQPRYLETKDEIYSQMEKGITDFQYTSIMDYGGRVNTDWQGLGSYDTAAIMFAYAGKIQVFDNSTAPTDWKYLDSKKNAGQDLLSDRAATVYRDDHYSRLLYYLIDNVTDEYIKDKDANIDMLYNHRKWVNYKDVLRDVDDPKVIKNKNLYLTDKSNTDGMIEVPYAFCSDEYHGGKYKCYRFALGVDMYESVMHQIDYYNNWYFITNFWRGSDRFSENSRGYMNRIYGRFDFIANQYKHWVNEVLIINRPYQRYELEDLTVAAIEAYNFFADVLGTIDPGFYTEKDDMYKLTRKKDYLNNWDESATGSEVEVKLGVGKYQETVYDPDLGYSYYYTPVVQGTWLDKIIAMEVLGDERTNFMGIDASSDSASYAISFNMIFGDDMMRTLGGIILEKPELYAPYYYDGKINKPMGAFGAVGLSHPDTTIADSYKDHASEFKFFEPTNPFYVKYYATLMGLAYYSDVNNMNFSQSLDINILGNEDSYTITEDYDQLTDEIKSYIEGIAGGEANARARWTDSVMIVKDPITSRTYYSANIFAFQDNIEEGDLPLTSIGFEYLKDYKVAVDNYIAAEASGDTVAFEEARTVLREKRNFLDWIVKLLHFYKHPNY